MVWLRVQVDVLWDRCADKFGLKERLDFAAEKENPRKNALFTIFSDEYPL